MNVIVIKRHRFTDSWNPPPPIFCAVAENEEAAKRWIQNEVRKNEYMQGQSADYWIECGAFSLTSVPVFERLD